ncbi:MAG: polysaccharide biosynthesis/export family protein [Paracoccaceae bacterium]
MLLLTGCGTLYTSPRVSAEGGAYAVEVVRMTPAAVAAANRQPYTPRKLPPGLLAGAASGPVATRYPPDPEPGPYRLGVSDVISMNMTTYPGGAAELAAGAPAGPAARRYTVQDDGAVAVPDVGRIAVSGLTLRQAEEKVFRALVGKRLDPGFSLDVAQFNAHRAVIGGKVGAPQSLPVAMTPLYLADALQLAGGVLPAARAGGHVRLRRGAQDYVIPLAAIYGTGGRPVRLIGGDRVFVDGGPDRERQSLAIRRAELLDRLDAIPRDYVYLAGETTRPARLPLPFGRPATLADALFDSAGIGVGTGDYAGIYVLRRHGPASVTAYRLDARNAADLAAVSAFEMRPGDIVFVAEQPVTAWNRTLSQLFPSIFGQAVAKLN